MIEAPHQCTSDTPESEIEELRKHQKAGINFTSFSIIIQGLAFFVSMFFRETYDKNPGYLIWPILFALGTIVSVISQARRQSAAENCAIMKMLLSKKKAEASED